MSNIAAHFAVTDASLRDVGRLNTDAPAGIGVHVDGDGYAEWGEPRNNGVNRADVHHVVVIGPDLPTVLALIRTRFHDGNTVTSGESYADPTACPAEWAPGRLSITLENDWSQKILERTTLDLAYL